MIQELTQQEGLEVPATGMPREGATAEIREPSSPSGLSKDLPFSDPQLGNKDVSYTLFFIIITDINFMVAESTRVAQVEDPAASVSAEDSAVQTSAGEPSTVEFVVASIIMEATTITISEVLASASVSEEPVVGLIPAQVESTPISVGVTHPVIERGYGSALAGSSPSTDIMKELAHQMVQQFFASMKSCIELVLSGRSSFEFTRMLLENQIENIRHTESPAQARRI